MYSKKDNKDLFNKNFLDMFFGKESGISKMFYDILDDFTTEFSENNKDKINKIKDQGKYSEETFEDGDKIITVEKWKMEDGSVYTNKTVKEKEKPLSVLEDELKKAIKEERFEDCIELKEEINKRNEKEDK